MHIKLFFHATDSLYDVQWITCNDVGIQEKGWMHIPRVEFSKGGFHFNEVFWRGVNDNPITMMPFFRHIKMITWRNCTADPFSRLSDQPFVCFTVFNILWNAKRRKEIRLWDAITPTRWNHTCLHNQRTSKIQSLQCNTSLMECNQTSCGYCELWKFCQNW